MTWLLMWHRLKDGIITKGDKFIEMMRDGHKTLRVYPRGDDMQNTRLGDHALKTLKKLNDAAAKNIDVYIKTAQSITDNDDYKVLLQYLASMTSFAMEELAARERDRKHKLIQ